MYYGSFKEPKELSKELDTILNELREARVNTAKKPSDKTLSAYRNIQEKLKSLLWDQYLDNTDLWVFKSNPSMRCHGCLLPKQGGGLDIIIKEETANFIKNDQFNLWKELNPNSDPIDFFNQTVIHEYGHVWLGSIENKNDHDSVRLEIPLEIEEAFAYMLGDFITGTKTDFCSAVFNLALITGNVEKSKMITYYYNDLKDIASKKGIKSFDRTFWKDYLKEHCPKAIVKDFLIHY